MIDKDILSRFLGDLGKTREPGLIISDTVSVVSESLATEGCKQATKADDIDNLDKAFVIPNENDQKAWYDIASQFSSGYIEHVDNGKDKMIKIETQSKRLIFIISTDLSTREPNFKRVCGLTIII